MEYLIVPKYCDPGSILLVNTAGGIKRLFCPFRVICKDDRAGFPAGTSLWVEEVGSSSRDELIYWILGKAYLFGYFELKTAF